MAERRSIAEARRLFPTLVHEAERGETVELTRHGEYVAVLLGRREFERLRRGRRSFAEAWREFADSVDLDAHDFDPDELFGGIRDADPGRTAVFERP